MATNICPPLPYAPYDSNRYQIQAPIVYFQGDADAYTPTASALYHYFYQTRSSQKTFVQVRFGGHVVLGSQLTCSQGIWADILMGQWNFSDQLDVDGHCLN